MCVALQDTFLGLGDRFFHSWLNKTGIFIQALKGQSQSQRILVILNIMDVL